MNWDWEKLQGKRGYGGSGSRSAGSGDSGGTGDSGGPKGPGNGDSGGSGNPFGGFKPPEIRLPSGAARWIWLVIPLMWLASGIFLIQPDEAGVIRRFGAFDRVVGPGPHYRIPWPVESVQAPKVTQVRRIEIGFRSLGRPDSAGQQYRLVPEESLMLTGDENIVDVQFIVQYQIKDPVEFLFNVSEPDKTVKDAAEASMREVIGQNNIDSALTTGKLEIQIAARDRLQAILDSYKTGVRVTSVQLQDVHPPKEVVDAFKDVASAREDKNRIVNEAEAYRNDILPRARGDAAAIENVAEAYRESLTRRAKGEIDQFKALAAARAASPSPVKEFDERLYLEAMETIFAEPGVSKLILTDPAADRLAPYIPVDQFLPRQKVLPQGGGQVAPQAIQPEPQPQNQPGASARRPRQ